MDDLDRSRLRAVATGHLLVHLADSAVDGHVTVLLVHVVRVGAGLVPEPDAVVLGLRGGTVEELVDCEQLAALFFALLIFFMKYQNLDRARTAFLAKSRIR